MVLQVRLKLCSIHTVLLKLEEQFGVIDDIKAFTEIKQAEERYLILIVARRTRSEIVTSAVSVEWRVRKPCWVSERRRLVMRQLLYNTLYDLEYDGDNGYWSEVGRIGGITGFVDRIDK